MNIISSFSALFLRALKTGNFPCLNMLIKFLIHLGVTIFLPIILGFGRCLRLLYIWPVPPYYSVLHANKDVNGIHGYGRLWQFIIAVCLLLLYVPASGFRGLCGSLGLKEYCEECYKTEAEGSIRSKIQQSQAFI